MKITEEQFEKAANIYWSTGNFRDALESIPEPIPRLRPWAENFSTPLPDEAVRLFGYKSPEGWLVSEYTRPEDEVFLDALLPLEPKPSKLTIQEELMNALDKITKVNESSPVLTYQKMESIAHEALNKVKGVSHEP